MRPTRHLVFSSLDALIGVLSSYPFHAELLQPSFLPPEAAEGRNKRGHLALRQRAVALCTPTRKRCLPDLATALRLSQCVTINTIRIRNFRIRISEIRSMFSKFLNTRRYVTSSPLCYTVIVKLSSNAAENIHVRRILLQRGTIIFVHRIGYLCRYRWSK